MTNYSLHTDEALCAELPGESGEAAFTQLYERHSEKLYHNILKLVKDEVTAEEMLQDVFAKLWQKRHSLTITENFAGYIYTISRNRIYDYLSQVKKDQQLYTKLKAYATEHYSHIEEALLQKENKEMLTDAISQLSPVRRKVFELAKLEGLSYNEIAEQLGITASTVGDHLQKARLHIREHLLKKQDSLIVLCLAILLKQL